jgi:non-ribosomal peptide synthase protein (TIGR01720 family)
VVGAARAEEGPAAGPVALTPIQRWWLSDEPVDPHHFNQSVLLESREPIDAPSLEDAVRIVLRHHDALRLRVSWGQHGWEQQIVPFEGAAPFERVDLAGVPELDRATTVTTLAEQAQASLDLGRGPLLRVTLFASGPGGFDRLLIVVHHFAVDGVSWRVLLDDLWSAYEALRRGEAPTLPPRTTSIQRWARRLSEHAQSDAVTVERDYWLSAARRRVSRLPVDHAGGENVEGAAYSVGVSLSAEETEALLRVVPEAYRTQINDALMTALAQALAGWTGVDAVLVDLEGHGREELFNDVDLTRTVGWFTVIYPMLIELPAGGGVGEALVAVKEQLRAVPHRGIGYGLLRYLRDERDLSVALSRLPQAEVSFNYLGQLDQALPGTAPLRGAREGAGPSRSARGRRRHEIDVRANIAGGRLSVRFVYAVTRYEAATVELLADRFIESLRALLAHCADPTAGGPTPSDLLEPGLSQEILEFMATMDPDAPGEED